MPHPEGEGIFLPKVTGVGGFPNVNLGTETALVIRGEPVERTGAHLQGNEFWGMFGAGRTEAERPDGSFHPTGGMSMWGSGGRLLFTLNEEVVPATGSAHNWFWIGTHTGPQFSSPTLFVDPWGAPTSSGSGGFVGNNLVSWASLSGFCCESVVVGDTAYAELGVTDLCVSVMQNVGIGEELPEQPILDFGGGIGVLGMVTKTQPTTTPVDGGILYIKDGGLWYKGSGGTETELAPI